MKFVAFAISVFFLTTLPSLEANARPIQCSGSLGKFDVQVIPSEDQKGSFEILVLPTQVPEKGNIGSMSLGNPKRMFQSAISQIVINEGDKIHVGRFSAKEINQLRTVRIAPATIDGSTKQKADGAAVCRLPRLRPEPGLPSAELPHRIPSFGFGRNRCDGPFGKFDVYLIEVPRSANPRLYELHLSTVKLANPKSPGAVVVGSKDLSYRVMTPSAQLKEGEPKFVGYLTEDEVRRHPILSVLPPFPNTTFLESTESNLNLCFVPYVGEGDDARNGRAGTRHHSSH